MNKSKTQTLEVIEDNILVSIQSNKSNSWLKENQEHSFYVPKNYTISHLRAFLTSKIFSQRSSHEASYFLFAYGCILNNHEKIGTIYEKFRHQIKNADKGLEIKYTEMSSFGGGAHSGDTMVWFIYWDLMMVPFITFNSLT